MRGFLLGFILVIALGVTILSIRPGGFRRQLRFAARRLRLVIALGAVYVVGSAILRYGFPEGQITDFGTPVLAVILLGVFFVLGQDPPPDRTT